MGIRLADTLEPMADFPSAYAKDIAFNDGDTLQKKLDTGSLGGGGVGYKQLSQAEYDALTEDEKLDGREYRTYDTGHIYKLGIEYGKDAYFTSLSQLGLTADATIEDVVNVLKNGESFLAPVNTFTNYETIFPNKVPNDKWNKIHIIKGSSLGNSHIRCFSQSGTVEYLANINNTNVVGWNDVSGTYTDITDVIIEKLGNEILKYPVGKYRINSTTTGNKFIDLPSDSEIKCGLIEINGTAVGKSPFTDTWVYRMYKFECLTGSLVYTRRLNSGATAGQIEVDSGWREVGQQTFTSLSELGLTADATFQDVIDKLPKGGSALLGVTEFTNYQTIFPYEEGNDQFARVRIVKGPADGSRMYARWFRKDGVKEAIAIFNINDNKFNGWQEIVTENKITDVLTNTSKTDEVPNANLVANEIHGKYFDIADYNNAMAMPIGKWRVDSNNKASQMQNLPVPKAGILEVKYLQGNDGHTAYTSTFKYAMLTYTVIDGNKYERSFNSDGTVGHIVNDTGWKEIATKTYNSVAELNRAKGTNIELVNGEDNTKKIVDALSVGEQFISFYHNNANQNRFGIDVSYGSLIHELRITKCLDADLTANYATVTAFMNTGCVMSRIYYKTYSTDWSSTKDYVESLT